MINLGYIVFTLLLLTIPAIGIFLIYSALTGKGIEEPEKDSCFNLHAQYKLRGLTGVGFLIAGILILWEYYSEILG